MGYLDIDNLYKDQTVIRLFKECYALEKIHGTSTHIAWKDNKINFFAGGCKHESFITLFDEAVLTAAFIALGHNEVVIFGEGYGGKCQGMSDTYGKELRFIAFDVKIGDTWLSVPDAEQIVKSFDLEFVPYALISTALEAIDAERDKPSEVAVRRGCGADKLREGIVLRPIEECCTNRGRVIAKHKRDEFRETKTPRPIDTEKLAVLQAADAIAEEWTTEMRLTHILDGLGPNVGIERMPEVLSAMVADIEREGSGEIVASKDARRAISKRTAIMFKNRLKEALK